MTYTFDTPVTETIGIDDYVDFVNATVDVRNSDSVIASVEALQALGNNPTVVIDRLNEELHELSGFERQNRYTAQVFELASGPDYLVRANTWVPQSQSAALRGVEEDPLLYEAAHNHDFSFLTVGHLGPGYSTKIWKFDSSTAVGYVGERVHMEYMETATLNKGKAMYYRIADDVHAQYRPPSISVSLNLVIRHREDHHSQFLFDPEGEEIVATPPTPAILGMEVVCELAGYLGDGRTANLLEGVAVKAERPHLRMAAYDALTTLETDRAEDILAGAQKDRHEYVRRASRQRMMDLDH